MKVLRSLFPMQRALSHAAAAACAGEVPVGAVITDNKGHIVVETRNRMRELSDPSAHAEILALRALCSRSEGRAPSHMALWVTLEPCPMCAQAISFARISRVYFGAYDPKGGGVEHGAEIFKQSSCFYRPEVYGGILEEESSAMLKDFFRQRR